MRGFVVAALALAAVIPSQGGQPLIKVDVSLGDVSINKVPQLVAADQGIYAKYGLDVHQTISAGAARAAAASGVVVPESYVKRETGGEAPIQVGGGSPMIHGSVVSGRPSLAHLMRPPSITLALPWPKRLNTQRA